MDKKTEKEYQQIIESLNQLLLEQDGTILALIQERDKYLSALRSPPNRIPKSFKDESEELPEDFKELFKGLSKK